MTALQQVTKIIAENLGVSEALISPTTDIQAEFCPDSLDRMAIASELESVFRINVPAEIYNNLTDARDLSAWVETQLLN